MLSYLSKQLQIVKLVKSTYRVIHGVISVLYGAVVKVVESHIGGRGSIPGISFFQSCACEQTTPNCRISEINILSICASMHYMSSGFSAVVKVVDSYLCVLGSIPGRFQFSVLCVCYVKQYTHMRVSMEANMLDS